MRSRIVIVDDHRLILDAYASMLADDPDFTVVGRATDGLAALEALDQLKPELMLLDIMMPGLNGLEVLRRARARFPSIKIVVVSMHETLAYVSEALDLGAAAYVLKQAPAEEIVAALRAVGAGDRYLSPPLSFDQLAAYEAQARTSPQAPLEGLSPREREVLQLAAEGCTNVEIGDRLGIGKRTVETHRANLMRKLALKSHAELVKVAVRNGMVTLD